MKQYSAQPTAYLDRLCGEQIEKLPETMKALSQWYGLFVFFPVMQQQAQKNTAGIIAGFKCKQRGNMKKYRTKNPAYLRRDCSYKWWRRGELNPSWSTASPFYCAVLPVIWQVLLHFSWWVTAGDFHDLVDIIYQISTKSIANKRQKHSGICLIYIFII